MLLTEFFNNPMGKGSTVLNINATKEKFNKKYALIEKNISHSIFINKKDIYISVNIPSSVNGIFYDVVIKCTPNSKSAGSSIVDMDYKFFSNSPSFLYSLAHAYAKRKLLVRELDRKLSKQLIKDIAVVKNPYSIITYDYTIYCALRYILINGYHNLDYINRTGEHITTLKKLYDSIQDWEVLQKNRSIRKQINKNNELNAMDEEDEVERDIVKSKKEPSIKKTKNTSSANKVPKTKKIKKKK